MKKSFSTLLFLLLGIKIFAQPSEYVPHELIIQLQDLTQLSQAIQLANKTYYNEKNIFRIKEILSRHMHLALLEVDPNVYEIEALEKIKSTQGVTLAQLNHYTQDRTTLPNDTYFSSMWGLDNTGQSGGVPDADIDAPEAWDITTGGLTSTGDTIVIAVIDGGFQLSHIDINFWKNYHEIPGNALDDDGNGYVDDVNGWNAVGNSPSISSNSHGTHVAGTIGAKGNNGSGTMGVSWNVKVMAIQGSSSNEAAVVRAYNYVLANRKLYDSTNGTKGAFVVATNSSFGVDQGQPANYPIWCAMYDSLGASGILSAGATANQNWNIDAIGDIPTGCTSPYLISVTNTTRMDQKYTSAGYGLTTIDLGAPGTTIYSTVPTNNWSMSSWTGTSMATPHAAGTIGLMFAAACPQFITDYKVDPAGKAIIMRDYLLNGVDTLASLNNLCSTGGRLNAHKALINVQTYSNCITTNSSNPFIAQENNIYGIFPNPASTSCEIEYQSDCNDYKILVKDQLGHTVRRYERQGHKGINRHHVNLEFLASGVYHVIIETLSGKSKSKLLVIY